MLGQGSPKVPPTQNPRAPGAASCREGLRQAGAWAKVEHGGSRKLQDAHRGDPPSAGSTLLGIIPPQQRQTPGTGLQAAPPPPSHSLHTHAQPCTLCCGSHLPLQCSPLPSGRDRAARGFLGHTGVEEPEEDRGKATGPPPGQGGRASASLDLHCCSRLRLAAEEAALGLESTRTHVLGDHRLLLPGSICFPRKPTGLGCQASLRAHSSGSALGLRCSICLRHRLLAPLSRPPYSFPKAFSCASFLPNLFLPNLSDHIGATVPEVFSPFVLIHNSSGFSAISLIFIFSLSLSCIFSDSLRIHLDDSTGWKPRSATGTRLLRL
ncbi:uncharacterized protein LOC144304752 [Canis aureus]